MDSSRVYYDINEVSAMLGEPPATLRYWESQFPELHPERNRRGVRLYSQEDIDLLQHIVYLTRQCGLTLHGAREQLRAHRRNPQKEQLIAQLEAVRNFLVELKETL